MFRFVAYLLVSILLISVVRSIVGVITKGFADLMSGGSASKSPQRAQQQVPLSGELKRDPVCGTYVSTASSIKKAVGGQTLHFCSAECRDKYKA